MDFLLSEMQKMLRSEARSFFEKECPSKLVREMEEDERGYPEDLWKKMVDSGWTALPFPDEYGGVGGDFLDLVVLIEEMGRACCPSPFISTVVLGGYILLELGSEKQKKELIPEIASGNAICTFALLETSDSYDFNKVACSAVLEKDTYSIKGTKLFIPYAHIADYIFVVAKVNGAKDGKNIGVFIVDTKTSGLKTTMLKAIDGGKLCEVELDVKIPADCLVGDLNDVNDRLTNIMEKAAIAKSAEMVGGAQRVLELTIDYSKERKQFGRPIGSNQAIQHHCANMAIDVEASRLNTYHAAWLLNEGLPASKHVAVAKAWTSEAYRRVVVLGHQIHGAIGFTKEMDVELYVRRAKTAEIAFGDYDFHRDRLATELASSIH
jgi:alkylation response protein AidB-like acyl-CoA dehydrogenase